MAGAVRTPEGRGPMPTMGEVLQEARYRRNVSLEEAEYSTRIRKKYLIALEEDDYGALPAPVYARGFLEIYAEYLGLDPAFVAKLFQPSARSAPGQTIRPAASGFRESRGIPLRGLLAVALTGLGVAGILYLYGQYLDFAATPKEVVTTSRPTVVATAVSTRAAVVAALPPSPTPTLLPTPSPTPVRGVEVVVQVSERTWMRVVADGQSPPAFEGELHAGDTRIWKARDRVDMRVGNAGGVEVTVNGMRQGKLGASGEVKNVTWGRQ